jgi:hypothetical protein
VRQRHMQPPVATRDYSPSVARDLITVSLPRKQRLVRELAIAAARLQKLASERIHHRSSSRPPTPRWRERPVVCDGVVLLTRPDDKRNPLPIRSPSVDCVSLSRQGSVVPIRGEARANCAGPALFVNAKSCFNSTRFEG